MGYNSSLRATLTTYNVQNLHIAFFFQFPFAKNIAYQSNHENITAASAKDMHARTTTTHH
jgi:hypothetical protein